MRDNLNDATLKTSWKNAVFGVILILLTGAGARFGAWYFIMWMGDPEIFWTKFATLSVEILMLTVLLPVITYLIAYGRYKRLAALHPADLHGVAVGEYGKPSRSMGFLLVVLEILALAVTAFAVGMHFKIDINYDADRTAFITLLAIGGGAALLDLLVYCVIIRILKPDRVQAS